MNVNISEARDVVGYEPIVPSAAWEIKGVIVHIIQHGVRLLTNTTQNVSQFDKLTLNSNVPRGSIPPLSSTMTEAS